jgi:hypothetical protein
MQPDRPRQATVALARGWEENFVSNADGGWAGTSAGRRRRQAIVTIGLAILVVAGLAAVAAAEKPTTVKVGNLVLTINGGVTPKALPRKEMVPITLNVSGKIETADGKHPPALKEVIVDTDKNGTIDARGVPTCNAGQLEATTTATAEKTCKPAIVGTGTTDIEVEFPEQAPIQIKSKLLAFNGGTKGGTTTIYIHAYLTSPVTAAVVTTVKISKEHKGRYGTRSIASVPKIAGGSGSVTAFSLTFQKKLFTYKGKQHGYLLAKCADGHFDAEAEAVFTDGTKLGGKIVRACTPKG